MDLKEILSITGKPGLFKIVAQTKNGVVVESLIDNKRITAFSNERMSSLEEISIFSEDEDIPLKDIFKSFHEKYDGKSSISHKSDNKTLKSTFGEIVPNYDAERVYVSDIKKVIQWYNLLAEKEMLNFEDEAVEENPDKTSDDTETTDSVENKNNE
jgi:hypothetical protein